MGFTFRCKAAYIHKSAPDVQVMTQNFIIPSHASTNISDIPSFGFLAVVLAVYLSALGYSDDRIGLLFSLTLLGDAAISLFLTSHADKYGRKRTLLVGGIICAITSFIFAFQSNFWVMLIAGIFGVISPSGNEIGPFMAIELSGLAQVTSSSDRTRLMAWYNLFGCFASALGAILSGLLVSYFHYGAYQLTLLQSYQALMALYAVIQVLTCFVFLFLSPDCEVPLESATVKKTNPVTLFLGLHKSKIIVLQLSLLFMMDSFGGSFILQSLISKWFFETYATKPHTLGTIVFICNIVAGISALFAAKIADFLGLVITMSATHLPSNILVILVPLMPSEFWSIVIICCRCCISQMDVPLRNAYVQSVVDDDERSAANGVTNVVRSIGASTGPYLAGLLYGSRSFRNYPFFVAGVLKIIYDILIVISFVSVKPPEEAAKAEARKRNQQGTQDKVLETTPLK